MNPFEKPGRWYKANLHTHTDASDGHLPLGQAVEHYRNEGYDVLAITDHGTTSDVRGLSDRKMLVISGTEYHPPLSPRKGSQSSLRLGLCENPPRRGPRGRSERLLYHLVGLNVPGNFEFRDTEDANRCIAQVQAVGGQSILAHPFWSGIEYEDFRGLEGLAAIEVYNTVCDRRGRACSDNEWAYALDRGMNLPAVAVDDAHWDRRDGNGGFFGLFGGWTWLKMTSLSVRGVLEAIRGGSCYASCGPKVHDFRVEGGKGGKVRLRCSPVVRIHFMGDASGGGDRRAAAGDGTIRGFSIDVPDWRFVRAVVTDARGRRAWTNPIRL